MYPVFSLKIRFYSYLAHNSQKVTLNFYFKFSFFKKTLKPSKFQIYFTNKCSLNNLTTKLDDLDVGKFKTVSVDLKKLSDVVDNQAAKNTKFNTLKTKVNDLEKKFPDATTLIHINQYNNDKHNLEKKWRY